MKIGNLIVTPKGLESLARSLRTLGGESAILEVHQIEDTHKEIKLCLTPEAGWIDITKGWCE